MKKFYLSIVISFMICSISIADEKNPSYWSNVKENTQETLTNWKFWAPMGAVVLLQINDMDKKLSRGIINKKPIFGTSEKAGRYSDRAKTLTSALMFGSTLLIDCQDCWDSKFYNLTADYALAILALEGRNIFKYSINRTRPSGGPRSFASGHTAAAFARTNITNVNIENSFFKNNTKFYLQTANLLLATSIAYARIEAEAHYLGDVMFSMGFSYFVTNVIKRSFYHPKKQPNIIFRPIYLPQEQSGSLNISFQF